MITHNGAFVTLKLKLILFLELISNTLSKTSYMSIGKRRMILQAIFFVITTRTIFYGLKRQLTNIFISSSTNNPGGGNPTPLKPVYQLWKDKGKTTLRKANGLNGRFAFDLTMTYAIV